MLKEALFAAALGLISLERNDRTMAMQALQVQTMVLRKLREGFNQYLENKDRQKCTILSATALALSMSDLLVHKSWPGFSRHLRGVGALIDHAGPTALDNATARAHFLGYRSAQVSFSLLERRGSFLARREWIELDWRKDDPLFCQPVHSLLDIAYQISNQMELFDATPKQRPGLLKRQMNKLNALVEELDQWKAALFEGSPPAIYRTEAADWGGLHTDVMKFSNLIVASSFTLFTGVRVALFSLIQQVAEDLKHEDDSAQPVLDNAVQESLEWSRIACQCLEYFFTCDQNVLGRPLCLFPFDVAWSTFAVLALRYGMDMKSELEWCRATSDRIVATGLPVFATRHQK